MNVFVIGGAHPTMVGDAPSRLASVARRIGASVARSRHTLLICSPYEGSADVGALTGFAAEWGGSPPANSAEIHYPDRDDIVDFVAGTIDRLGIAGAVQKFRHPSIEGPGQSFEATHSWLLCQLAALDRCHGVIAMGGSTGGSANLLLNLCDARRVPVLPLPYFGGAAQASFGRRRYELLDRLGARLEALNEPGEADQATGLLEAVIEGAPDGRARPRKERFFVSYPRARPAEADFVEMTLRRRNQDVFRDDHGLEAGGHLPSALRDQIHAATVFVAMWGQDYACSPWCHDELELALDRRQDDHLKILLIRIDDTRIVPPRARDLVNYRCLSREEIEVRLLAVIDGTQ